MNHLTNNQSIIVKHIQENLLKDENIREDGSIDFDFVEADLCLDIAEGKLDAVEDFDDFDVAFGVIADFEKFFNDCCEAIVAKRMGA